MKILVVTLFSLALVMGLVVTSSHAASPNQTDPTLAKFVGGTVEGIDPMQKIVSVQSEEKGEVRLLAFTDAEMVKGLTKGDRVVIELDERGMAKKIVKAEPSSNGTPDSTKN